MVEHGPAVPAQEARRDMQFMLMLNEDRTEFDKRDPDHPANASYWGAWGAYIAALNESGVVVAGAGLEPPTTATTVRMNAGDRLVQDGPYADSKEQLGGYFVIDVDDLDAALDWAARSPAAENGSVEVRPVMLPKY
jgi:hypothetical protein